jgi:hypothetical protein
MQGLDLKENGVYQSMAGRLLGSRTKKSQITKCLDQSIPIGTMMIAIKITNFCGDDRASMPMVLFILA